MHAFFDKNTIKITRKLLKNYTQKQLITPNESMKTITNWL
jgi:hypothetical protein